MFRLSFSFNKSIKNFDSTIHYVVLIENNFHQIMFFYSYTAIQLPVICGEILSRIQVHLAGEYSNRPHWIWKSGKPELDEWVLKIILNGIKQIHEKKINHIIPLFCQLGGRCNWIYYAATHSENIKIVFMEAFCVPMVGTIYEF
jgi:hypothetical protein